MSSSGVPTYPGALTLAQAALVARLNPSTVRRWADRGKLTVRSRYRGARRYVSIADVLKICDELGILPDWEALGENL